MSRKMHLMWFSAFGPRPGEWQHPAAGTGYRWTEPEIWQDMARALERGGFDLILFSDQLAIPDTYGGSMDAYLRTGQSTARHDPSMLIAVMAMATERIGLSATMSTTFWPPYLLARLMTTLDHLSRGRVGWNVVTSCGKLEAQNLGYEEMLGHDERYDRADEYMELCYRLWSSWEPDAVVMDKQRGIFADPAKVRPINFEGKYHRSRGPLNAERSPQGRPVIVQAGSSERGKEFAARHAEVIITSHTYVETARAFYDDVKTRMLKYGRDPDECKIFFIARPVIGETEDTVRAKAALRRRYAEEHLEAGLADWSASLQVDLSTFELDEPINSLDVENIRGMKSKLPRYYSTGRTPTLREVALDNASGDYLPVMGTPEQIADQLEEMFETIGGDGFAFREALRPEYVVDIVDYLIPILQERGRVRTEYSGATLRENLRAF